MALTGAGSTISVTERDLLQIKLDIHALQSQGVERHIGFVVGAGAITCSIESASAERCMKLGSEKALEFFKTWVNATRVEVTEIVERNCPTIRNSFNAVDDVRVEISYSYGMGGIHVCTFVGNSVKWST